MLNGNAEIAPARLNGAGHGTALKPTPKPADEGRDGAAPKSAGHDNAIAAGDDTADTGTVETGGWRGWPDRAAAVAAARRLVEGTTLAQKEIARQVRISARTLSDWKCDGGWTRPEGAPEAPDVGRAQNGAERAAARKEKLVSRLFRVFDRQLMDIESRARQPGAATEEKDARTLGTLARTLGTLMALGRGGGDQPDDPEAEAVDPDDIRAKIAQRLFGVAKGGTES